MPTANIDEIPGRYIRGCQGDMVEARRRWALTVKWRQEYGTDNILNEPFPNFNIIKENYPHALHRRAKDGNLVYYEVLGKINIAKLREQGVSIPRLVRYYIAMTEFIWEVLDPREDGKVVTIMDVKGIGIKDLYGEALEFLRTASDLMQMHYVERSARIFVINAPTMFTLVWKVVSPWINETTRQKVKILGSDYKGELLKYIDAESLPRAYGGQDPVPLFHSEEEMRLKAFIEGVVLRQQQQQLQQLQQQQQQQVVAAPVPSRPSSSSITSNNNCSKPVVDLVVPAATASGVQAPIPFLDNSVLDGIVSFLDARDIAALRTTSKDMQDRLEVAFERYLASHTWTGTAEAKLLATPRAVSEHKSAFHPFYILRQQQKFSHTSISLGAAPTITLSVPPVRPLKNNHRTQA